MAKSTLTIGIKIDGVFQVLRAFKSLPKEAQDALRVAGFEISTDLASAAKSSGQAEGSQAALVATTVKAVRDRVPVVQAGGTKKLGSNKKPAYKLLFGSEFGASTLPQYKPHVGSGSYWFFKTIETEQAQIAKRWLEAADEIIEKFGGG